jgi:hypothetical protein
MGFPNISHTLHTIFALPQVKSHWRDLPGNPYMRLFPKTETLPSQPEMPPNSFRPLSFPSTVWLPSTPEVANQNVGNIFSQ